MPSSRMKTRLAKGSSSRDGIRTPMKSSAWQAMCAVWPPVRHWLCTALSTNPACSPCDWPFAAPGPGSAGGRPVQHHSGTGPQHPGRRVGHHGVDHCRFLRCRPIQDRHHFIDSLCRYRTLAGNHRLYSLRRSASAWLWGAGSGRVLQLILRRGLSLPHPGLAGQPCRSAHCPSGGIAEQTRMGGSRGALNRREAL